MTLETLAALRAELAEVRKWAAYKSELERRQTLLAAYKAELEKRGGPTGPKADSHLLGLVMPTIAHHLAAQPTEK